MLKTLGRSVYLTQFEEQRASLSAFAAGGAPVFISLHISEEFDAAYCARVQEMCDFLSAQGWRILADVSEKTIRQFGCADLTALAKRLHLWGLRLDYGFSLEEMCALAQQLPVAVNASTTTPEVARQLAAGGGTVIAMHNFYPRPETGLDPEFLRESTAALQAEGLQVYGFIPGDALLRGPLYAGLPTLEAHRTAAPSAAFADLALNYGLDGIFEALDMPTLSPESYPVEADGTTTGDMANVAALYASLPAEETYTVPGYAQLFEKDGRTVRVIGDSFSEYYMPYLQARFAASWREHIDTFDAGIIDAPGCDILILEFNERSLDKLLAILEQF